MRHCQNPDILPHNCQAGFVDSGRARLICDLGSFSVGEEPFSGFYCLTGNAAPRHSNHSNQDYGQDSTSVGPRPDYATVRLYHTLCVAQGGAGMLPASFVYIRFACR